MNWTELLTGQVHYLYKVTQDLMDQVDDTALDWRPETGSNWMTTGQLLKHITTACGFCCKGFATGDWGLPEGADPSDMPADEMLPPADKMPTVESVAEAKRLLEEDKQLALSTIDECGENDLATRIATAPWDANEMILGQRMLQMLDHLSQHKSQLFYYLKLQGKPVNTQHLWGM